MAEGLTINLDHLAQNRSCCVAELRQIKPGAYIPVTLFKQRKPDRADMYVIDVRGSEDG
jgi:hypothetical protein